MLLDQNFYENAQSRYANRVPGRCQLLLGPRYALLREEFRRARERTTARSGPVRRMLVFFGGVDAANHTALALEALRRLALSDVLVDVVIGADHPNREEIEAACDNQRFVLHVQTARMRG